uniref:Bifunctional inhibitor/plant lipid transfer protein/seed storage helical domain-containing protein n=1 Tax=Leersia perrieri TaxID=77586 RepID=A0A0D9VKF6_9ORYZ
MAPSKLTALFFAFAVVAASLAPAAEATTIAVESKTATAAGGVAQQPPTLPVLPGLPFPLFPFLTFPFPTIGSPGTGAPPSSSGSGFPFPFPFPLPPAPGSPPSSGFPFPLPFPIPLPAPGSPAGAPPSSGSSSPFPFPFPIPSFPFPIPGSPGSPPSSGSSSPFPFPFPIPSFPFPIPGSPPSQPLPQLPSFPMPQIIGAGSQLPSPAQPQQQPKECMTPLMSVMPCADYLTNATVQTPPAACCDGFRSLVSTAPICLCHGMNGDLNRFLPNPVEPMKMMLLPATCGAVVPMQTLFMCSSPAVPPLMPPSPSSPVAPAPASPPVSSP